MEHWIQFEIEIKQNNFCVSNIESWSLETDCNHRGTNSAPTQMNMLGFPVPLPRLLHLTAACKSGQQEDGEARCNTFNISSLPPRAFSQQTLRKQPVKVTQQMLYLSPGLETLELLESLVGHWSLHLLEDQVFLGFQGHLGHLLDKYRKTRKKNLRISAEELYSLLPLSLTSLTAKLLLVSLVG